jgi:hypothetical protein
VLQQVSLQVLAATCSLDLEECSHNNNNSSSVILLMQRRRKSEGHDHLYYLEF